MNLVEMIRFDQLRYQSKRTVPEQVEYDVLLERVKLGKDGISEFDTSATWAELEMRDAMQQQLCDNMVNRIKADLWVYGPRVAEMVINALIAIAVKR